MTEDTTNDPVQEGPDPAGEIAVAQEVFGSNEQPPPQVGFWKRLVRERIARHFGSRGDTESQQAYRQQHALEYFTNKRMASENDALQWTDKAFEAQKGLDDLRYALALQPEGSTFSPKLQQEIATREQYLAFITDTIGHKRQEAEMLGRGIPGMIAASSPPPMGESKGKAQGDSFPKAPVSPPGQAMYDRPSYASPKDANQGETSGPEGGAFTPPPEEAPVTPQELASMTPARWKQELEANGFPQGTLVGNQILFTVDTQEKADQLKKNVDEMEKQFGGVAQIPAVIQATVPQDKEDADRYQFWYREAQRARARAGLYKQMEIPTKDETRWKTMLAMAHENGDQELENNLVSVLSATGDERKKIVKDLVDEQIKSSDDALNTANGFKPALNRLRDRASGGASIVDQVLGQSEEQTFLDGYLAARDIDPEKATDEQLAAAMNAYDAKAKKRGSRR